MVFRCAQLRTRIALHDVIAVCAQERVVSFFAKQVVVTGAALDIVVVPAGPDFVVAVLQLATTSASSSASRDRSAWSSPRSTRSPASAPSATPSGRPHSHIDVEDQRLAHGQHLRTGCRARSPVGAVVEVTTAGDPSAPAPA